MRFVKKTSALILFFLPAICFSQEDFKNSILIRGTVIDSETFMDLPYSMIVNKNTGAGHFADMQGKFSIAVSKADTIIISARGYHIRKICLRDSIEKAVHEIEIPMRKLSVTLREVEIFPQRKIEEIESDILKLKEYDKQEYMLSGLNAVQSPFTYFYQQYSRRENSKRKVAELKIEEAKRGLMKELLHMYVNGNIIKLDENEVEDFIDYCDVNIEFMKNSTQYDFIMFIKKKHNDFIQIPGR